MVGGFRLRASLCSALRRTRRSVVRSETRRRAIPFILIHYFSIIMFYFYTLFSQFDKKLYYGSSSDIEIRVDDHNNGKVKSTRKRRPLTLVYFEAYLSKKDARKRELEVKNKGHQRERLKRKIENSLNVVKKNLI